MTAFALAAGPSPIADLQAAVLVLSEAATPYDDALALAEAEAILACEQVLKVLAMRRIADVDARKLHERTGFRSVRSWLRDQRPDGDVSDATLGTALREFPLLSDAVDRGDCSLAASRKVVYVLRQCRRQVDTGDGLIDGFPSTEVLPAVIGNVVTLVSRYLYGLTDDDPRLASLLARTAAIRDGGGSELHRLEQAFTLLACEVPVPALTALLDELLVSLLPSVLERRAEAGQDKAGLELSRKHDGSGWRLQADLDLECGERLFTALRSEAARDPQNPADTGLWLQTREAGLQPWDDGSELLRPRDKRRRLHDALDRLLLRYLDAGLGGLSGKAPIQLNVVLPSPAASAGLAGSLAAGSLPARADSGALIPRALVRRWWCDSTVTAFVMSLGGKALRTVHGQRTLTRRERAALQIETGGLCAALGCCSDRPDPERILVPHHAQRWADHSRTSLDETFHLCKGTHHAIHAGKTVLLRDGRYLSEAGVSDHPPDPQPPPF